MDSPDATKITIVDSTSTSSPTVQDSPFFNYLSNLSPINPVKAAHVAQVFSELNIPSPLPVFTSPRVNLQQDMKFLQRLGYSHSSNAELPLEHRDRLTDPQLMVGLTPCTQKECDSKGSEQVQLCSPSGCVNEYLADTGEIDSVDNDCPPNLCSEQANDAAQVFLSTSSRSKRDVEEPGSDGRISEDMRGELATQLSSLEQDEQELHEKLPLHVESGKQQEDCEEQFVECTAVASERVEGIFLPYSSIAPPSDGQDSQQALPESLQIVQNLENHDQLSGDILTESVEGSCSNDFQEAGQHQRGTRRRCLQFEAAEAHKNSNTFDHHFSNTVNIVSCSSSPANPTELETLDSYNLNSSVTSRNGLPVNFSLPMSSKSSLCPVVIPETLDKFDRSVGNAGRTSMKAPKPSGIGLHLNSIVNAAAAGCNAAPVMNSAKDSPTAQREKSLSVTKHHLPEEQSDNSIPSSAARQFSAKNDSNHEESMAIVSESTANFQFPRGNADKVEDSNQLSPKRKRKRTAQNIESEGCKRCNCKRSKCLKLYCECFAAGIYCAEPCACVECFNKPEYEDTVLETRQQIESRNPLAFAPKIVQRITGSPVNSGEDGGRTTPSSARHKRGCNCKKSMCLKKYCECYQAGVGCSDGCRCDGCKNIFGIKEDYFSVACVESNEMEYKKFDDDNWEEPSDGKLDTRNNYIYSEHCHSHSLTPQTPLPQSSNYGKELHKSLHPARGYLPSPESDNNTLSSYRKLSRSPRILSGHDEGVKMGDPSLGAIFCDQELTFNATIGVDQFSPRCNGIEDICDLTPLRRPPPRVMSSSSSSNTKEFTRISQLQLHGNVRLSGSLRLHAGSVTPICRLGGSKLQQESDSHNGCGIMEDDTPEILKDSSTPIKAVKASSPNQKRVSPPHSRFNELRSSSSPGLRSGRKFVLQSISSFPPLTPYSDPKGSTDN